MPLNDCPSRLELDSFQAGNLEDAELASLESHIEGCSTCQKSLETVIGESADKVLAALLEAAEPDTFASEASCRTAVERVTALARELSAGGGTEATIASAAVPGNGIGVAGVPLPVESIREYKLLAKLGEGGMGAVYKALHTRLDKVVALKVLPADRMRDTGAVARFQREMKAVGKLDHPNIVRAMDAGEEGGMHFLVMEYVEGLDLSQLAKNTGPLHVADACELVRQAALGLAEAHEHGMVHRDIKPSNLILAKPRKKKGEPTVKILDLGLALLSEALAPDAGGLTTSGQMMGTIDYMAPEQGGDSHQVDIRADIYSLGATLYRLLTGSAPFAGEKFDTPVKKLMALATQSPTAARSLRPEVPAPLAAIIDKMLAKSPAARFATPEELAEALTPFCKNANLAALLARASAPVQLPTAPASEIGTQNHLSSPSGDTAPTIDHAVAPLSPGGRGAGGEGTARAQQEPRPLVAASGGGNRRRIATIAAACGSAALAALMGVIFYVQTQQGTIQVEINDPAIKVVVDNDGNTVFQGVDKKHEITVKPGLHGLTITRGDLTFNTDKFELKRGKTVRLLVEFLPGKIRVDQVGHKILGERALVEKSGPETSGERALGWALAFDGKTSTVWVPRIQDDLEKGLTVEAIVTWQPNGKRHRILHINRGVAFEIRQDGSVGVAVASETAPGATELWHGVQSTSKLLPRVPTHVAGVFEAGELRIFIDGRKAATTPTTNGRLASWTEFPGTPPKLNERLSVGSHPNGNLQGELREIRISDTARYRQDGVSPVRFEPDSHTLALYHIDEGQGDVLTDSSGNGHHGKIVGAKWVKADGTAVADGGLEFDGIDDYVSLPTLRRTSLDPFTIELWAEVQPQCSALMRINGRASSQLWHEPLGENKADVRGYYGFADERGASVEGITASKLSNFLNRRVHVAHVWDKTEAGFESRLYVDGQPVAKTTIGPAHLLEKDLGFESRLAGAVTADGKSGGVFQGRIFEVRVSQAARYREAFQPEQRHSPDADTVALYHFDEGAGTELFDSSGNGHHGKIVGAKWVRAETSPPVDAAVTVQKRQDGGYEAKAANYLVRIAPTGLLQGVAVGQTTLIESTAFGRMGTAMPSKVEAKHEGTTLTFTEGDDYRLIYEFGPQGFAVKTRVSTAAAGRDGLDGKSNYLFHQTRFPKSAQRVRPLDGLASFALPATNFEDSYTNSFVVDFADGSQIEVKCDQPSEHSGFFWTEGPYTWGRTNLKSDADNEIRYEIRPPGAATEVPDRKAAWHGWPADAPPPAIAPFDAAQAKQHQEAWAKHLGVPVEWENSLGMKFRLVPPGEFRMGSTPGEIERSVSSLASDDPEKAVRIERLVSEGPQHKVVITQPYYLGTHEVTQQQFESIMERNPAWFSSTGEGKDLVAGTTTADHPVEMVHWFDATHFCELLSRREGFLPYDYRCGTQAVQQPGTAYRLPTEAEFEYAARAGTTGYYGAGDAVSDLRRWGWYNSTSGGRTHRVGELGANQFGLFDVLGNVEEWVQDWYAADHYQLSQPANIDVNGPPSAQGIGRIRRSGSWAHGPVFSGVAKRSAAIPTFRVNQIGFRVALAVDAVRRPAGEPRPPVAAPPAPTPLYEIDFAESDKAWVLPPNEDRQYDIRDGRLVMKAKKGWWRVGRTPAFDSARLQVRGHSASGSWGFWAAGDWRATNGIFVCLSSSGAISAWKVHNQSADNNGYDFVRTPLAVVPKRFPWNEQADNELRAVVRDQRVSLWVNGEPACKPLELENPIRPVSVWLAGYSETDGLHVEFDSLRMWDGDIAPPPAIAPFDAEQAKAHQDAWAKHLGVPAEWENSIGMKFRLIPPGEFLMGSPAAEIEEALTLTANEEYWQTCIKSEAPQHRVILTQPIYLGVHEVTQADYVRVMGTNPSFFAKTGSDKQWVEKVAGLDTTSHPVEGVSWNDGAEFCAKLSAHEKLKPFYSRSGETVTMLVGNGYRLPTEAQWEFACRAGTTTRHWSGETDESLARAAWFNANSGERTHAVGELAANPFGLFDIQGNVWEWVADEWSATYYGQFQDQAAIDPSVPPATNFMRTFRGGIWYYGAPCCRAAFRHAHKPDHRAQGIGLRVALPVDAVRESIKASGYALEFNGKDSYVDLPTLKYDGSYPITLEATIVPRQAEVRAAVINVGGPALWFPNGSGGASALVIGDATGPRLAMSRDALMPHQKLHVAGVLAGSKLHLFVNGSLQGTNQLRGPIASVGVSCSIGAGLDHRNPFAGTIDEVRISKVARYDKDYMPKLRLEADEHTLALYHFDEGKGDVLTDSSGHNHHGKIVGAKWVTTGGSTPPATPGWHGWPAAAPPPAIAPFDAAQAIEHQTAWAKYLGVPVEWENSVGMKFALIPPGEFMMGSTAAEKEAAVQHAATKEKHWQDFVRSEAPQHRVVLTRPFYVSAREVTQKQYTAVMKNNPAYYSPSGLGKNEIVGGGPSDDHPVEMMNWLEAAEFCASLSDAEKLQRVYTRTGEAMSKRPGNGYRLLSEAEWEFACRAGTTTTFWTGDQSDQLPPAAWFDANSRGSTRTTGTREANPFGLFDMHGNVWEWVEDYYEQDYFEKFRSQPAVDPTGPAAGSQRIVRGGDWGSPAIRLRSSARVANDPPGRNTTVGFRVALSVEAVKAALKPAPAAAVAPFDATQAKALQKAWAEHLGVPEEYSNSLGMKFRLIPPGQFLMGSTPQVIEAAIKAGGSDYEQQIRSEGPQHKVVLTKPIYLGVHEVRQSDYEQVMGQNPSRFAASGTTKESAASPELENLPVEMVSWNEAIEFCTKLSEKEQIQSFTARGSAYRLPTEAEWEFACRGGTTTNYWTGDAGDSLAVAAWVATKSTGRRTHAVGELRANPLGLFDMHGNVWEWVHDRWEPDYFAQFGNQPAIDPQGATTTRPQGLIRGGAWDSYPSLCRSATRYVGDPKYRNSNIGFRVALGVDAVRERLLLGEPVPQAGTYDHR